MKACLKLMLGKQGWDEEKNSRRLFFKKNISINNKAPVLFGRIGPSNM